MKVALLRIGCGGVGAICLAMLVWGEQIFGALGVNPKVGVGLVALLSLFSFFWLSNELAKVGR